MADGTGNYRSIYDQGFVRVAAVSPRTTLGDPKANVDEIARIAADLSAEGVGIAVFPELCVAGHGLDDLLHTEVLLDACWREASRLVELSEQLFPVLIIGLPMRLSDAIYSCALVIHRGQVLGIVPSTLPIAQQGTNQPAPRRSAAQAHSVTWRGGVEIDIRTDMLFECADLAGLRFHLEIGSDAAQPLAQHALAATAGATLLINLDASPAAIGRAAERRAAARAASMRHAAACVYVNAGAGGSSSEFSWDGQTLIAEAGDVLAEGPLHSWESNWTIADVDLDRLQQERVRRGGFTTEQQWTRVGFELQPSSADIGLRRKVERFPFFASEQPQLDEQCAEAFQIQSYALGRRLAVIGDPKIVLGVSGGLDSTHALLVAAKALDAAGRPRSDILAFTMPGFATTDHTRNNAEKLALALGCTFETLDIRETAELFLTNIGHPLDEYDVTFENVQAGLRTDYLFRIANQRGGIVLGTGDLSELALGWCTYGVGDQMSHYAVNAGVPKTLMQQLVRWAIRSGEFDAAVVDILQSILDTEITPELVPTTGDAKPQSTQGTIGPYNLHDFFVYWTMRYGFGPRKIALLAEHAWSDRNAGSWPPGFTEADRVEYSPAEIRQWLAVFGKRFYTQQFKRTASPSGPQVSAAGSLSPRTGWRMPSDANARAWLAELDSLSEA